MGFLSRERPKGLELVAFQISGSISGRPILWAQRCAVQKLPFDCSTMTASSV